MSGINNAWKDPKERWRTNDRHYCQICNAWMSSDRNSILVHENGKKHKAKLEESLTAKREIKEKVNVERSRLEEQFRAIENAAAKAHVGDVLSGAFANSSAHATSSLQEHQYQYQHQQHTAPVRATISNIQKSSKHDHKDRAKEKASEMDLWHTRKQRREGQENDNDIVNEASVRIAQHHELEEHEGHYKHGSTTYLDGSIFGSIVQRDMPAEIWIGPDPPEVSIEARCMEENSPLWKTGIVIKIHRPATVDSASAFVTTFDFAYLRNANDKDETIDFEVECSKIRLVLGGGEGIPGTMEEARLALRGGEHLQKFEDQFDPEIDENTGFSSWAAIAVRKTTVKHEEDKIRARIKARKMEENQAREDAKKESEARMMEEARHANADDSALGAYDVWNSGKGGYKGVKINHELKLDISDTAKSLANGEKVSFKKRQQKGSGAPFKKNKKKNFRRKTSGDE
mmetsp:Transcript_33442/g.48421  ORF Transcript_33442/g.48421 Transcript_33442/m.48421 type:complete len:458 (-) Transcript_33442:1215-2588(-)|eukprot:CAMPEP_0116019580 /NCGR_PEP_ID=MMETSP0321-20121206/9316_1 /TAXON_ID=163516 /ORGANISM="Leptocylindrus danicus var. danicus, Strain B650" /LENGTH=457 /DNA_ID=CAMNT_0003490167 /DNA_START=53 /DNA_END=1426 /DNA_ORIENTATION=-